MMFYFLEECMSPTTPTVHHSFGSGQHFVISGLSQKDSYIADPWNQLHQLVQMVAEKLKWNVGRLFEGNRYFHLNYHLWQALLNVVRAVLDLWENQRGSAIYF